MKVCIGSAVLLGALLAGCVSVDLASRGCLPPGVPGTVTLKRAVYLYRFDGEKIISLTDWPDMPGRRKDGSGKYSDVTITPLRVLPAGTQIKVKRVTRRSEFDNGESTDVRGTFEGDSGEEDFRYVWGVGDKVDAAPWESDTYAPSETRRLVCGEMPPGFTIRKRT